MIIEISLENTIEFFKYAKERAKLFNDHDFDQQIRYFSVLCSKDKISSNELISILDIVEFCELWFDNVRALKKYTNMVIEIGCYVHILETYNETAKIKEVF